MNKELQERLERPFDHGLVKKRKGPGGKMLSYVPVGAYIARLCECFGDGWSFEIVGREHFDNHVLVEGRLTAGGVTKAGIGGADLHPSGSLTDAMKSAASDSLKRCARLFGVGLYLYDDEESVRHQGNRRSASIFGSPTENESPGRISRAQLEKLKELVQELGAEWRSFRDWVRREHKVSIEYANRQLASELIGELISKAQARKGNGAFSQHGGVQ